MKRCSLVGNRHGMTLVELLVAGAIGAVVLSSLCCVYFIVGREWERQQSKQHAISVVSDATSQVSAYVANAVGAFTQDHFMAGDALVICLPPDSAYGTYVPVWEGSQYHYRQGTWIIFYLSDTTGSYYNEGDILWAATITDWETFPDSIVPDQSWSLSNADTGRFAPISYLAFGVFESGSRTLVNMEIGSWYRIGKESSLYAYQRSQALRNEYAL